MSLSLAKRVLVLMQGEGEVFVAFRMTLLSQVVVSSLVLEDVFQLLDSFLNSIKINPVIRHLFEPRHLLKLLVNYLFENPNVGESVVDDFIYHGLGTGLD